MYNFGDFENIKLPSPCVSGYDVSSIVNVLSTSLISFLPKCTLPFVCILGPYVLSIS